MPFFVLIANSLYALKTILLHSFIYNQSRLAPLSLASLSALKNSICEPLAKLYLKSEAFQRLSTHLPVSTIIFLKSLMHPRLRCGIDSLTTEISVCLFFAAMSMRIGSIAYVLPTLFAPKYYYLGAYFADVPPCTPLTNLSSFKILFIAVVRMNI